MSSDHIQLTLGLNADDALIAIEDAQLRMDELMADWAIKRNKIVMQANAAISIVNQVIRIYRGTLKAMGMTIDPVLDSILTVASTAFMAAMSWGRMLMLAGPVGMFAGGIVMMLAMKFQLEAQEQARRGMADAAARLNAASGTMLQIGALGTTLGRYT